MWFALMSIANSEQSTEREVHLAKAVAFSIDQLGVDYFKIHPKGDSLACKTNQKQLTRRLTGRNWSYMHES